VADMISSHCLQRYTLQVTDWWQTNEWMNRQHHCVKLALRNGSLNSHNHCHNDADLADWKTKTFEIDRLMNVFGNGRWIASACWWKLKWIKL